LRLGGDEAASGAYRPDADQVAAFRVARCVTGAGLTVRAGALYQAYERRVTDEG